MYEPSTAFVVGALVLTVVMLAGVGYLIKCLFIRRKSMPCIYCRQPASVHSLWQVPQQERETILGYFLEMEARKVSMDWITVCEACHCVGDDHSGSLRTFCEPGRQSEEGLLWSCKLCDHRVLTRLTGPFICTRCRTQHRWQAYADTGYIFFAADLPAETLRTRRYGLDD